MPKGSTKAIKAAKVATEDARLRGYKIERLYELVRELRAIRSKRAGEIAAEIEAILHGRWSMSHVAVALSLLDGLAEKVDEIESTVDELDGRISNI